MNEELVLDAREVDGGHDVTLNRGNLSLPLAQRLDRIGRTRAWSGSWNVPDADFQPSVLLETLA
jgi:hypothetical protein